LSGLNRSGKVTIRGLLTLVALAAVIYYGREFGRPFLRKLKLEDAIQQHASFAGQLSDEAIREKVIDSVADLRLPAEARRVSLVRTLNPRVIRISLAYSEPLNLLFTKKNWRFNIQVNRGF